MKQYPADTIADTDRSPETVLLPDRRATLTTTMSGKAVHSTEFYASQSKAETLRLDLMAQPTGIISLQALGSIQDATIVDFGAGNSSWLGQQIEEGGARYIGLDTRPDAVESLATAGLESHILESDGRANNLPPHCADKIHARFVLSWLDVGARREALEEMFRLVKADGQLVIIDYNWDAIQGPPELMTAVKTTIGIMQDFGFDPQYGTKLDTDIPRTIKNITGELGGEVSYHSPHAEPPFEGTLRDALAIIRQTAESVKSGLMRAEKYADIAKVETALAKLETYAAGHPDAPVRLAD
ncbi:MAG TPA: class I SAM-dependent methyltransferase, partial [Candidatus Nanoperiomorbaceae bacterium]|nr:class I SAM-dependent methyltransferase [Candidatus Nanoperiomorbaceae bacterium]